jgi:hypothetical protein
MNGTVVPRADRRHFGGLAEVKGTEARLRRVTLLDLFASQECSEPGGPDERCGRRRQTGRPRSRTFTEPLPIQLSHSTPKRGGIRTLRLHLPPGQALDLRQQGAGVPQPALVRRRGHGPAQTTHHVLMLLQVGSGFITAAHELYMLDALDQATRRSGSVRDRSHSTPDARGAAVGTQ